jgi:predicted phage tail component-like protein
MSTYGLTFKSHSEPFLQETGSMQLSDRAYALASVRPGVEITLDVVVSAASFSALVTALDNVKKALNYREDKVLKIDSITDRYWNCRFVSMVKQEGTTTSWVGSITFYASDPCAYANTATSTN